MIALDTNYLIRFFTNDIKSQALIAKGIIKESKEIYIPTITIAETVYFLRNHYQKDKELVCNELASLVKQSSIKTQDFVPLALQIYKSENISFYDSLLLGEILEMSAQLKTFDKRLLKVFKKYSKN